MKRFLLLFFFLTRLALYSQENFVIFDINENPLENVDVFFVDQSLLVKTNDKGIVSIDNTIPENSYIHLYNLVLPNVDLNLLCCHKYSCG